MVTTFPSSVLRHIDQLKTKLCKDVLDKFTPGATTASTQSQRQEQTTSDTNERCVDWSTYKREFSLFVLLESTPRTFSLTSQLISMNCLLFELLCRQRERPSRLIDDDPLRLPPRRPPDVRNEWYMYFQGNIEQYRKQSFTPPPPPYLKINLVYNRFLHGYGPLKAKVILIKNRIDAFEMITSLKCSFSSCVWFIVHMQCEED